MNVENDIIYCSKLKAERKKRKWTQQCVAEKVGISRSYYNDIENGRVLPSGKVLLKLNKVLPIFLILNDVNSDSLEGVSWKLNSICREG
ncbi:helix-turn-helix domain-containing protein [Lysinibacillus fusiformis]|uniref:helix-turn-helix domain-containing protein n=1 Tax=Lysinibacillus fusiformis TaxID=28031 RepID=UPI00215A9EEC|nr:helix-turn-helix transcriptional regulator [Lysinibacillus fusiformis]MCR8853494.1 helix-turn-helix transcriptional regulator [Lysinibacillus fusiformis]